MAEENLRTTIGDKVKAYRQRMKLSQMDLEMEIGMSNGVASRIECGQINPTKETLLKISKVLELSSLEITDLLTDDISSFKDIFDGLNRLIDLEDKDFYQEICQLIDKKLCVFGCVLIVQEGENLRSVSFTDSPLKKRVVQLLGKDLSEFTLKRSEFEEKNIIFKSILEKKVYQTDKIVDATINAIPNIVASSIGKLIGFKYGASIPFEYKDLKGAVYCISTNHEITQEKINFLIPVINLIARIIYLKKHFV